MIILLSGERSTTKQEQIPDTFRPESGKWRVRGEINLHHVLSCLTTKLDLHKIYIDDQSYHSGYGHAYDVYGVDRKSGAIAIVRPDGCKSRIFLNLIRLLAYAHPMKMSQWFWTSRIMQVSVISSPGSLLKKCLK